MYFLRNLRPAQFPQIRPQLAVMLLYLNFNSFLTGVFVNLTSGKKIWDI